MAMTPALQMSTSSRSDFERNVSLAASTEASEVWSHWTKLMSVEGVAALTASMTVAAFSALRPVK